MKRLLAVVALAYAGVASAEPTLYPSEQNMAALAAIKNSTNSNVIADTQNSSVFWVMPPNTAEAQVTNLHSISTNVGFCREVGDLQAYSRETMARINRLNSDLEEITLRIQDIEKRKSVARAEASKFATEKNMTDIADLTDQIAAYDLRLTELNKSSEECREGDCDEISRNIRQTRQARTEATTLRQRLVASHAVDYTQYLRKRRAVEALDEELNELFVNRDRQNSYLFTVRKSYLDAYSSFASMYGGRAALNYSSNWGDNIATLRAENPGLSFQFIQTANAKVMANALSTKYIPTGAAVIGFETNGNVAETGVLSLPNYPGSLSSNLVLSVAGACPVLHPEYFDLADTDTSIGGMKYGLLISYDYESVASAKVKVTYNMYKIYKKIVSSGSSGGLFRSRSWTNVEEREFFRDSMDITIDDRENLLSKEQEEQMEADMRRSVLARLVQIALPSVPDKNDFIKAGPTPKRGATVVADSLAKACPTNAYCVGASLILQGLDAIFGSSKSSASYTHIEDRTLTENYNRTEKVLKPWVTAYNPPQE